MDRATSPGREFGFFPWTVALSGKFDYTGKCFELVTKVLRKCYIFRGGRLMGALLALARSVLAGGARLGGPLARRAALPVAGGLAGAGVGELLFGGDGDGRPRRRRRRRVLTANDRADISFITATLGAPAGKAFAMIVAARV